MADIVVGVVGAGRIGKLHINNMRNMANVRVKMVSDVFADHLGNGSKPLVWKK